MNMERKLTGRKLLLDYRCIVVLGYSAEVLKESSVFPFNFHETTV
jgi:hypothetical protein